MLFFKILKFLLLKLQFYTAREAFDSETDDDDEQHIHALFYLLLFIIFYSFVSSSPILAILLIFCLPHTHTHSL